MTTATKLNTVKNVLDNANPNDIHAALQQLQLGTLLSRIEEDSGAITASATYKLTKKAAMVCSARVVTSGTAGSVGSYLVGDSASTPVAPAAANTQPGVARLGTDDQTLTFPNTVTRVVVVYLPLGVDLDARFERAGVGQ